MCNLITCQTSCLLCIVAHYSVCLQSKVSQAVVVAQLVFEIERFFFFSLFYQMNPGFVS